MPVAQWARLQMPARCGLRWGAWYPVMGLSPREAQLWVHGRAMGVARSLLELRGTPPREWTVACAAAGSDLYLVCPGCRHRARFSDLNVAATRCPRCNEVFTIAWGDAARPPSRDDLRPDRRMTRRRMPQDRRNGDDRRGLERRIDYATVAAERRTAERRVDLQRRSRWDRRRSLERRHRATNW
jgi:hypothetical protein